MNQLPGGTILAIDDEPLNLELLVRILTDGDHDHDPVLVHTVDDPRRALRASELLKPDVVMLDVNMPHLTGFEVMEQLQGSIPGSQFVPILIMTADADIDTRRKALAMGAQDFVTKPFDPSEVRLRVRNFLQTRQLYTQLARHNEALEERVEERTRDLTRANEHLAAANRLKTDFLAMISHEMRTPLTLIQGFNDLITRRWDQLPADQRQQHAEAVERNISRLEAMIDQLLRAAELEQFDSKIPATANAEEVSLASLIHHAIDDSIVAPEHVEVNCAADATVRADAEALKLVLTNLLDNAHKYGSPPIEVQCAVDEPHLDITVRDHGQGVPPEFVERLFDRFAQASVGDRRTATGSGLGLWIARRLTEEHGAELTHEPQSPGALFRLRIPRDHQRHLTPHDALPTSHSVGNARPT